MIKSIMAGVFIGIGCTVFTMCENRIAGSLLFSLGLCAILTTELDLFTGKVGYYINDNMRWPELIKIWTGNLIGISTVCLVMRLSRWELVCDASARLNDGVLSLFLLAVPTGLLMYTATRFWKLRHSYIGVILCVSVFILCGFEHCIADMYYVLMTPGASLLNITKVLLFVTLGNTLGGFIGFKTLK